MKLQSQAKHFSVELPSRHVKGIHLKIKDFKCDACDYASVEKKSVANHRRAIHGYRTDPDDVDHECDICEKSFANTESLRKHKLYIHDKIRNYSCDACEYVASRRDHLNRHKAKMHATNSAASVETGKCKLGRFQEEGDNSEDIKDQDQDQGIKDQDQDEGSKIKEWVCDMCEYVATQGPNSIENI